MKFKELFTGRYNVLTDKIEGCTPGTYIYFHEEGHQSQFKNNIYLTQIYDIVNQIGIYCGIFFSILFADLYFIGLFFLPYISLNLFLELDAHIFAIIKYFKNKK